MENSKICWRKKKIFLVVMLWCQFLSSNIAKQQWIWTRKCQQWCSRSLFDWRCLISRSKAGRGSTSIKEVYCFSSCIFSFLEGTLEDLRPHGCTLGRSSSSVWCITEHKQEFVSKAGKRKNIVMGERWRTACSLKWFVTKNGAYVGEVEVDLEGEYSSPAPDALCGIERWKCIVKFVHV